MQAPTVMTNAAGEAIFKIVAVSYDGAGKWVEDIREVTRPEFRGEVGGVENEGWIFTSFDFRVADLHVQGRPVRVYLFAHEGLGFIGQPGSAKDVVYRNAHAIVALAGTGSDMSDLNSVVGADLQRLTSQGQRPFYILAAPVPLGDSLSPAPGGAAELITDWRTSPLEVLRAAIKAMVRRHQPGPSQTPV